MITQKEIFLSRGYNVPNFYYDADGRQVEIETREDEEQCYRFNSIVKLLIDAGYYRAKIKGITPFDIIVGGMTWCIDSGDIDLDVDLLFEDGLSIGQKIALIEKIVVVLPKIKCPHSIEPHEIQGLNFIQIHPVIEWLINWSLENRERQAAYLKAYARNQFHKNFTNEATNAFRQEQQNAVTRANNLLEKHQPKRTATQTNKNITDIKARMASTLAEYGFSSSQKGGKSCLNLDVDLHLSREQEKSVFKSLSSEDFSEAARKKLTELTRELNSLKAKKEELIPALQEEERSQSLLASRLEETALEIENLTEDEQRAVKKIQKLIEIHEALREEERSKKESFKEELSELQNAITELENVNYDEEIGQLQQQCTKLQNLLLSKKMDLANIARNVTSKERQLERVPTRAELSQYQKRFMELYHIHTLKTAEAKQDIMTYNMLSNRLSLVRRQYNIINSISEFYSAIKTRDVGHFEFFQTVEGIIEGVVKTKEKIVLSKAKTEENKKKLLESLNQKQNLKTEYAKAVNHLNMLYKKRQSCSDLMERIVAITKNLVEYVASIQKAQKERQRGHLVGAADNCTMSDENDSTKEVSVPEQRVGAAQRKEAAAVLVSELEESVPAP